MQLMMENLFVQRGEFKIGPLNSTIKLETHGIAVILGPNGAGKSTLLRVLSGVLEPIRGRIVLAGEDITHLTPQRRGMGLVAQEPYLFPNLTVEENLLYGAKDKAYARRVAERLGITQMLHKKPQELSGGQQQRVSIARAVATQPKLLLMDEPFSHLDLSIQAQLRPLVRSLATEENMDVLFVTHNVQEAYWLGDIFFFMDRGNFVESILPRFIEKTVTGNRLPRSRKFAELLGYTNFIEGKVICSNEGLVRVKAGNATIEALGDEKEGENATVAVRPEDISISRTLVSTSQRNNISMKVKSFRETGPLVEVLINDEESKIMLSAYITRSSFSELRIEKGAEVYAVFKATAAHTVKDS